MSALEQAQPLRRRVAVYHPWVYLKSGLERTLMEIRRRSRHDWTIYTSHFDADGTYPDLKSMGVKELTRVSVRRRYGTVLRAAASIAAIKLDPGSFDALVVSCDGLGSLLTLRNHKRPVACLCFTPLRAVYDEEYRARHLANRGALAPLALGLELGYKWLDRRAWRHYSQVWCISQAVRERVLRGKLCSPEKTCVAYPGIDGARIQRSDIFERFFFLPGRIMWTKNIELGIEAFRSIRDAQTEDFRLVIAGMVDEKSGVYLDKLKALAGGDPRIEFIIGPSEDQMRDLYRRCYALLFTAFNEDLGLTPLEAMAAGKPSIAVNRGGPREIVDDGVTGLLTEPTTDSFAAAMQRLVQSPEWVRQMGLKGLDRCRAFTWEKYVAEIDVLVDKVAQLK